MGFFAQRLERGNSAFKSFPFLQLLKLHRRICAVI